MKHKISPAQLSYLRKCRLYHFSVTFSRLLIFFGFFFIWEYSTRTGVVNPFIFSSPSRIIRTFIDMVKDGQLLMHIRVTLAETLLSFCIIVFFGIAIAVCLWLFKGLSDTLEPFLVVLNSLPKSALAPMLIVWLGNNMKAIIVTAVSVAIFGTVLNLYAGFKEIDNEKITLIKTLGGNKLDILFKLILPGSKQIILSNMKVNIGLCLVGVIIGEFLAAKKGLGYLIIYGSQVFKMTYVTMSIIILCVISTLLFKLIDFLEKLLSKH
ncbi:MAG: ABC transporter permease [Lachnospira sp.]